MKFYISFIYLYIENLNVHCTSMQTNYNMPHLKKNMDLPSLRKMFNAYYLKSMLSSDCLGTFSRNSLDLMFSFSRIILYRNKTY